MDDALFVQSPWSGLALITITTLVLFVICYALNAILLYRGLRVVVGGSMQLLITSSAGERIMLMTDAATSHADYEAMAEAYSLVIIDLCAALCAPRMHLQAAIEVLAEQGVEVAIYSALPAWNTRAALRAAGMMEWFDYVWHLDAMGEMDAFEYALLQVHGVLSTPEQLKMKPLMSVAKVPPSRVPAWMRWLA